MNSITFSSTGGNVTVSMSISYSTDFWVQRLNQFSTMVGTGDTITYDNGGPFILHTTLVGKGMSRTDADNFRNWYYNIIEYQYLSFNVSAVTNLDLGKGYGTGVNGCYAEHGQTDNGILVRKVPGTYDFNLSFYSKQSTM